MKRLINWIQSRIFFIKYRLGLLEEGKDFITCGLHEECIDCMMYKNQDQADCEVKKHNEKY